MVENLKLPLCKENRNCCLNKQSASASIKKTWFTCLSTTNWCTTGTLRGRVLMIRLHLSLKWCTPLLRLISQFSSMITTWSVRSIISGSFESFYTGPGCFSLIYYHRGNVEATFFWMVNTRVHYRYRTCCRQVSVVLSLVIQK